MRNIVSTFLFKISSRTILKLELKPKKWQQYVPGGIVHGN